MLIANTEALVHGTAPTCLQRMKYGFFFGFAVGMTGSALLATCNGLRYGLRGCELISNVSKVMVQSGGTFGTFMSIGAGLRC